MFKGVKKSKLGRKASNRNLLLINLTRSLYKSGQIVTSSARAKALKQTVESLISKMKTSKNTLVLRRDLQNVFGNDELVKKAMEYSTKEKAGVVIRKVGFRKGDNTEESRIELIGLVKKKGKVVAKKTKEGEKKEIKETEVNKTELEKKSAQKSIDKSAVFKKTERAKSRSGL